MEEITALLVEFGHLQARDVCRLICTAPVFASLRCNSVWNRLLGIKYGFTCAVSRAYRVYRNRYRDRQKMRSGYETTRRRHRGWYLRARKLSCRRHGPMWPARRQAALRSVWCSECNLQLARWIIYNCYSIDVDERAYERWRCKLKPGEQFFPSPKMRPKRNPDHLYVWWDGRGDAYFRNPRARYFFTILVDEGVASVTPRAVANELGYRWHVPDSVNEWLNSRGIKDAADGVIDNRKCARGLRPWCATCYDKRRAAFPDKRRAAAEKDEK